MQCHCIEGAKRVVKWILQDFLYHLSMMITWKTVPANVPIIQRSCRFITSNSIGFVYTLCTGTRSSIKFRFWICFYFCLCICLSVSFFLSVSISLREPNILYYFSQFLVFLNHERLCIRLSGPSLTTLALNRRVEEQLWRGALVFLLLDRPNTESVKFVNPQNRDLILDLNKQTDKQRGERQTKQVSERQVIHNIGKPGERGQWFSGHQNWLPHEILE